jgi:alkylation response protein AidB-like acyl-CoA dehydrogenase
MDFALTEEQQELKSAARAWLSERYPLDRDFDAPQDDRWAELAELGWLGVSLSEDEGGVGLGFVEEALILEEMGYALYPGPYLVTIGLALPALGPVERAAVAAGTTKWSAEINGLVPSLGSVDHVVGMDGLAHDGGGPELGSIDPGRPVGRLENGSGTPLAGSLDIPRARAAMAAEAVGIAQHVLELAVAYVSTREQFGKPIGVYQAVAHQLSNTYADVELARSLAYWAAWSVAEDDEQAPVAAAAAKAFAAEAAVTACERSIQVHGGTGFTWEHPLHRFYKRALWLQGTGSTATALRAEVADAVIGAPVTV